MNDSSEEKAFAALVQQVAPGSTLLRTRSLTGGISAQITAVEIERGNGARETLLVRRHGDADLRKNPNIAADEFRLLEVLQRTGIRAPKPYAVVADVFPTPCVVIEFIDGTTEFAPTDMVAYVNQMAAQLAAIHRVDTRALEFLPKATVWLDKRLRERPARMDDTLSEGRIRAALEAAWPLQTENAPTLLHGDYWPGNLLWKDGRLAGVIDWEDAAIGDPLIDLGNCRLEMLWAFGAEAMERFTDAYRQLMPALDYAHLRYYDLFSALRPAGQLGEWAGDVERERVMQEQHGWFVARALEAIDKI